MKKLLFLVLLIQNGYSQEYLPLLDQTNQWHFTTCNFGCLTDIYYTNGDTLVNGFSHKILDGYHYISRTFLLREDVNAKKIYLTKVNSNSISEYLLYDFSLNEGQIINMINPISPFPQNGGPFVLDSIRQKPLVNNINYKHFYFSPTNANTTSTANVVWIEGIGNKSLINASGGAANINGAGHLSCFFKNTTLAYSQLDSINACNYQTLKSNDFMFMNSRIIKLEKQNQFYISNSETISKVEIYNTKAQILSSSLHKNNPKIEIYLENYPKGIYFLLVFDENNRRKSFKIIVE